MDWRVSWNLRSIPDLQFYAEVGRRRGLKSHPREKVKQPCPRCGALLGTCERRKPCPECGARQST
jgi:rubrerythrin